MATRLLQANLNRARRAQDLFAQAMAERDCGLGIAAEPHFIPADHPRWVGDRCGSVAITWRVNDHSPSCTLIEAGEGMVVVKWGLVVVVGIYFPPRWSLAEYEEGLDAVRRCIGRHLPGPVLVAGDFNAHSTLWGSPATDTRGGVVEEWANESGLCLLNTGSTSTFVAPQGESIIDLTWASPSARRMVRGWRVAENTETLSDHLYIEVVLSVTARPKAHSGEIGGDHPLPPRRRWARKRMDRDKYEAAIMAATWPGPPSEEEGRDLDSEVSEIIGIVTNACDVAMPRAPRSRPRRSAYWWTEELAQLRRTSVRYRRAFQRTRARRAPKEDTAIAYEEYRQAKRALQEAISAAKGRAWDDLLQILEKDPWGRPYKWVTNKLRPWAPPITETVEPRFLADIMGNLFPVRERSPYLREQNPPQGWPDAPEVTPEEIGRVIRRLRSGKAPGPDGIPGEAWALSCRALAGRLAHLFTGCLRAGRFPPAWGRANVVLLRKVGKPEDSPSAYRPICLLDEAGKLLERVISRRLVRHMAREGPNLSDGQYGFREGRSTIDAISRVRALSESHTNRGRVALTVSLDIVNAFNTLPWEAVGGG